MIRTSGPSMFRCWLAAVGILALLWPAASCQGEMPEDYGLDAASQPATQNTSTQPTRVATSPATQPGQEPSPLTVSEAILLALENNKALIVQRYNPDLRKAAVEIARAVFDPDLTASFSGRHTRTDRDGNDTVSRTASADIGLDQFLPTGTDLALALSTDATLGSGDDAYTSRAGLTATQSLLRGFGTAVNLASLRQARLDVLTSQYELRGFAETLVSDVEKTYWDYALALQQTGIAIQSLKIAQDQLADVSERIRVGKLSPTQLAAVQAEVARRKQDLIDARSNEDKTLLRLLRLISPAGNSTFQHRVTLLNQPTAVKVELGSEDLHVQTSLRQRPDLNQARLQVNRGDLEIVKTRNGLLPKLDLFITLGKTGYAESFGPSLDDLAGGSSYDVLVGLEAEYPPLNRDARARHRRAVLTRDQAIASVGNLAQSVEQDVRTTYLEVVRTLKQVTATAATRKFQEETLRVEIESFRVGRSTSLLVAQAQRDLFSSRNAEVQAVANYLKALVDLFRLEGSLLERRGIVVPDTAPVDLVEPSWK